jgi:hypothetical protein
VEKDGTTSSFTLGRPSFTTEILEKLQEEYEEEHKAGAKPLLKKGLARRHIVSSKDMAEHYEGKFPKTAWSAARKLVETKGRTVKVEVGKLSNANILAGIKKLHSNFFNDIQNLFVGDSWRNSQIGREIDREKPGMGEVRLRKHIQDIKKTWAIDGSFQPSGWDG